MVLIFASCEQKVTEKTISKEGSVEAKISIDSINSTTQVININYTVWQKNKAVKTFTHKDTIPALTDKETVTINEGDDNEKDVQIRKRYELFITVK